MKRRTFLKGSALGSMVAFFASSNLNASLLKDKDLLNFKKYLLVQKIKLSYQMATKQIF